MSALDYKPTRTLRHPDATGQHDGCAEELESDEETPFQLAATDIL